MVDLEQIGLNLLCDSFWIGQTSSSFFGGMKKIINKVQKELGLLDNLENRWMDQHQVKKVLVNIFNFFLVYVTGPCHRFQPFFIDLSNHLSPIRLLQAFFSSSSFLSFRLHAPWGGEGVNISSRKILTTARWEVIKVQKMTRHV